MPKAIKDTADDRAHMVLPDDPEWTEQFVIPKADGTKSVVLRNAAGETKTVLGGANFTPEVVDIDDKAPDDFDHTKYKIKNKKLEKINQESE